MSKKIAILLPYLKQRGTESQALRLARGLVNKGLQVNIFVLQGWGEERMYEDFRSVGAEVINVGRPLGEGQKKASLLRAFKLAWLLRKHKCKHLLSRAGMTNKVAVLASFLSGIKASVVISSSVAKKSRIKSFLTLFRWFYFFPHRIICVSKEASERLQAYYPRISHHIIAIQNGIDKSEFDLTALESVIDPQNLNFCYSGSIESHRKGLDVLIESFTKLSKETPKARLYLIGSGEDQKKLEDQAHSHGLGGVVHFLGEQANPYPLVAACDVFVLPSRKEGLPNALLEAMALGKCCVAADCDTGPREIIEDKKSGLLVSVGCSESLYRALLMISSSESLREDLSKNALKRVEDVFSYQRMVDRYFEVLT